MRNEIKTIKRRHLRSNHEFSVDQVEADPDNEILMAEDVSFQEWLFVHQDRGALLAEIDRLYGLLRRRRRAA